MSNSARVDDGCINNTGSNGLSGFGRYTRGGGSPAVSEDYYGPDEACDSVEASPNLNFAKSLGSKDRSSSRVEISFNPTDEALNILALSSLPLAITHSNDASGAFLGRFMVNYFSFVSSQDQGESIKSSTSSHYEVGRKIMAYLPVAVETLYQFEVPSFVVNDLILRLSREFNLHLHLRPHAQQMD